MFPIYGQTFSADPCAVSGLNMGNSKRAHLKRYMAFGRGAVRGPGEVNPKLSINFDVGSLRMICEFRPLDCGTNATAM